MVGGKGNVDKTDNLGNVKGYQGVLLSFHVKIYQINLCRDISIRFRDSSRADSVHCV